MRVALDTWSNKKICVVPGNYKEPDKSEYFTIYKVENVSGNGSMWGGLFPSGGICLTAKKFYERYKLLDEKITSPFYDKFEEVAKKL